MTQGQKDEFYDKLFAMIVNELKEDDEFLEYILDNHFGMTKEEVFEAYPNTKNLIVSGSSPKLLLKQKVNANFAEYKENWMKMSPAELIDRCEELDAVTRMAQELPSAVSDENAEYLLQFKNPLEVVSDEWISRNGIDSLIVDDEMSHLLWSLQDRGDAEQCYEMEPELSDEDEAPSLSM